MKNETTARVPVLEPGTHGSVLRVRGTGYLPDVGGRFGVGVVREGESARRVTGGEEVPGPWAYAYGLSVVLDNHGGTGAESARMTASGQEVVVDLGDEVELDGHRYVVELSRWGGRADRHNVELVPVADRAG